MKTISENHKLIKKASLHPRKRQMSGRVRFLGRFYLCPLSIGQYSVIIVDGLDKYVFSGRVAGYSIVSFGNTFLLF
jgi:hypothetical protein